MITDGGQWIEMAGGRHTMDGYVTGTQRRLLWALTVRWWRLRHPLSTAGALEGGGGVQPTSEGLKPSTDDESLFESKSQDPEIAQGQKADVWFQKREVSRSPCRHFQVHHRLARSDFLTPVLPPETPGNNVQPRSGLPSPSRGRHIGPQSCFAHGGHKVSGLRLGPG